MRTAVTEDRLLVVSDVHLGNRLHRPRRPFLDLLHFAIENDYSICINGDGIDIQQMSLPRLTGDLAAAMSLLKRFARTGRRFYYTVGNHDIATEHFLSDLGQIKVLPFLNLRSGDQRIRIEHGHMYDDMFLKFPRMYTIFTFIGRLAIGVSPEFYERVHDLNHKIIDGVEYVLSGFKSKEERRKLDGEEGIEGERECFRRGAVRVGLRGFDTVIFGHTHLHGAVELSSSIRYYNTGAWFSNPYAVLIDDGSIWFGPVRELLSGSDPLPPDRMADDEEQRAPAALEAAS